VVPVPESNLTFASDGNSATIEIKNVEVIEQPKWPALDAIATPARMSFKMVWKSTGEAVKYEDGSKHFRFTGTRATCQMEAQVDVPSNGFTWKSDPIETSLVVLLQLSVMRPMGDTSTLSTPLLPDK